MGVNFETMTIPDDVIRNDVRKRFEAAQEQDRYENGHFYSGGFGMARGLLFATKTFERNEEAVRWLEDNCQKWQEAIAVTFKGEDGKAVWLIGAWCAS